MGIKTLCIIAGVSLFLAIPTGWPYDFYVLLRWFIFGVSAYVAYGFYKSNLPAWSLIFGGIAFIFNPLFPIYLTKTNWVAIDFISTILFFIAGYSSKKNEK
jgi:hypothetical protein